MESNTVTKRYTTWLEQKYDITLGAKMKSDNGKKDFNLMCNVKLLSSLFKLHEICVVKNIKLILSYVELYKIYIVSKYV